MPCIRPATPGFLVTLVATILLAVVSFCVPLFKTIYFLKANFSVSGFSGSITFGTLGYCLDLSNGTSCSTPSVGYELDVNSLLGVDNRFNIEIPSIAVKWITYALVLHIVALGLAAGSAVFGLLAHVREMSMTCCSTCVSGFAAVVAMLAFIFDIVFFFVAKARINSVEGGKAEIGNAIWLTLAAWLLLFFSGCFYTLGRCCVSKRGPRKDWGSGKDETAGPLGNGYNNYAEQMRLDAVKAEADRKARQARMEGGLPAFYEIQPLTGRVEGNHVYVDDDQRPSSESPHPSGPRPNAGYVQAQPGTRAVDEYYTPSNNTPAVAAAAVATATTYPPRRQATQESAYRPQRQPSQPQPGYAQRQPSVHTPSIHEQPYGGVHSTSPPPMPNNQYLYANQQPSDPRREYGHHTGGSSYHSAASHQQQPTAFSQNDVYTTPGFADPYGHQNADPYGVGNTSTYPAPESRPPYQSGYPSQAPTAYYSARSTPPVPTPERQYTLGGDGYGSNSVPMLVQNPHDSVGTLPYPGEIHHTPSPPIQSSPYNAPNPRMLGAMSEPGSSPPDGPPPMYDAGTGGFNVRPEKS